MNAQTLLEIESSIKRLDIRDKIRLLEYLTPQIADEVLGSTAPATQGGTGEWKRYRDLGERLAATSTGDADTLTDAVSRMRR